MSPRLDRRGFLKGAAAAGLGAAAQTLGPAAWRRPALAQTCNTTGTGLWGDLVGAIGSGTDAWTCGNHPGHKILEIYMMGGSSLWETFWLSGSISNLIIGINGSSGNFAEHDMGSADLGFSGLNWATNSALPPCNGGDRPTSYNEFYPFAFTPEGLEKIYWGAAAKPLWRRTDIRQRCRMVTQFHGLAPHEAAVPYCLTGLTLGNERMAGTGAAIEHRARAIDPHRPDPASYVLYDYAPLALPSLSATGEHPGYTRPVVIQVKETDDFYTSLNRANVTNSKSDDLFRALRHEYRDRLRFHGVGQPIRSAGFDAYWAAAEMLDRAPHLQHLFDIGAPDSLLKVDMQDVRICPTHSALTPKLRYGTRTMTQAAAHLLRPGGPAQYVCVVDAGLTEDYDTHGNGTNLHVLRTCANHFDTLKHLADNIYDAQHNPIGKLNLNETMVVITTEFGRTSTLDPLKGRGHHPEGYVTIFIGGPIPAHGPTIGGRIDAGGVTTSDYRFSPTDIRGAMLLAAGIDPFAEPGNFRESDFSDALKQGITITSNTAADYRAEIRNNLRRQILGV